MSDVAKIVTRIRQECSADYVGVWQISRMLRESGHSPADVLDRVAQVVAELLSDRRIEIGQFQDGAFTAWQGSIDTRVGRLRTELDALGREPDIGDVAWLAER